MTRKELYDELIFQNQIAIMSGIAVLLHENGRDDMAEKMLAQIRVTGEYSGHSNLARAVVARALDDV